MPTDLQSDFVNASMYIKYCRIPPIYKMNVYSGISVNVA